MFSQLLEENRASNARKGIHPTNDHDTALRDIALNLPVILREFTQVRSDGMEDRALGKALVTVLTIAEHQPDLNLDAAELPPFYIADERSLADVIGKYCDGIQRLRLAPKTAHHILREQTIRLAGWVNSAAKNRKLDLGVLLLTAHMRQGSQAREPG